MDHEEQRDHAEEAYWRNYCQEHDTNHLIYGVCPDARYRVAGYGGIAFYIDRAETMPDDDTEWSGIENETGNLVMIMVGDDREFSIDPSDITPLDDNEYCSGCGQIGCTHDGR